MLLIRENEGVRNRKWKWKSVVIATTITGARALLGLEPYGALGCADLQSLDIKEYCELFLKACLPCCLGYINDGCDILECNLIKESLCWHCQTHCLCPWWILSVDALGSKGTIHSRPLYVRVLTSSAVTIWVAFFAPPKGSTCTQLQILSKPVNGIIVLLKHWHP